MVARVHASEPSYELQSLGWKSFQDLCATIVGEVLGQTVQIFLPSRDGGRDGAFHGQWKPGNGLTMKGAFTVQCKFSSKDSSLAVASLQEEMAKAARLAKRGLATNYILMTNLRVSGIVEESVRAQFLAIDGIRNFVLFGRDWITLKIRESPVLRMLVPRVYGLGDLSQILDERAYSQAVQILSALGDDLAKFVVTNAHTRSARALVKHGFVLLLGEPAAGKSTIAASLAVGALDNWGCSTVKVRNADEFVKHWNPHEPRQFFWVDDAFGATQYQRELASEWNGVWPHMTAAIRKGARLLFTSRDYIYRAARSDLKVTAFPLVDESQVVINVQRLSRSEKQQILYNHMKLGDQPRDFKHRIKPFLTEIAASGHFLPEIARRLGSPLFTRDLSFDRGAIRVFVEEPVGFLLDVVRNLDAGSRAALALVFMRGGALQSPIESTSNEDAALRILGVPLSTAREALKALDGSLVSFVRTADRATWTFKHPTIGDAYASMVAADPELLDIYMSWTSAEKLISEVTCGEVDLEGVKVIVPGSRFARFADRLRELKPGRGLFTFLANRCSPEFLRIYLGRNPELGNLISEPASYLGVVSEVDLLVRLHEVRLLPEEWRRRFVAQARRLAVETPDLDFLSGARIRALFTLEELEAIRRDLRELLLPALEGFVDNFYDNCDSEQDPEEWFDPLREVLNTLSSEFERDSQVVEVVKSTRQEIKRAIERLWEDRPPDEDARDYQYGAGASSAVSADRSVFDDVDE